MTNEERKALVGVMKDQIESWEFEDPREDWWKWQHQYARAADQIEADGQRSAKLEREKAVVFDLLEQQKELALEYLFDCNRAGERIAELEAALGSIARNTCCGQCQEAALVARAALGETK